MDALRGGKTNPAQATIPDDASERARHLKSFGYFCDAAMIGIGPLPASARLATPHENAHIRRLSRELGSREAKTLASGIHLIMADLRDSLSAPARGIGDHAHAIVLLYDMPRDPRPGEPGCDWLHQAQDHRACLLSSETAVVLANYIRLLGWDAKAHTATSSDVELNQLAVAAGLASCEGGVPVNPFVGRRFGVAAVTTTLDLAHDRPLAPLTQQTWAKTRAPLWWIGRASCRERV